MGSVTPVLPVFWLDECLFSLKKSDLARCSCTQRSSTTTVVCVVLDKVFKVPSCVSERIDAGSDAGKVFAVLVRAPGERSLDFWGQFPVLVSLDTECVCLEPSAQTSKQ